MESPSLGQIVASFKADRDELRDKEKFLERCQQKYEARSLAGLEMVGLGGSCGKPAFLFPFVIRFDLAKLERLEVMAKSLEMYVEYGAYPHLKTLDGDREIAAIQDWTTCSLLFLRPSYEEKEALITALLEALR